MSLTFKGLVTVLILGVATAAFATEKPVPRSDIKYYTIARKEVREISLPSITNNKQTGLKSNFPVNIPLLGGGDPIDNAGRVIQVARDMVALGEEVYTLVIKGKPMMKTTYAPISVIPKINNEPADILDTEGWSAPVKKSYEVSYKNVYNVEVIKFKYSVIYSYHGQYEGKGFYLTAVQIVPESVRTLFGYDFTATMKLGGIQNQGTKANPIAGATLLMEYTVSNWLVNNSEVDTFFVTGLGALRKF
jgi:hypothetical protein